MRNEDTSREQLSYELDMLQRRIKECEEKEVYNQRIRWELKKQKDLAEEYLNIAGGIIVIINADKQVALINRTGCEILGYKKEEIVGRNWFDNFIPQENRDEVKSVFDGLLQGRIEPLEYYENPIVTRPERERRGIFCGIMLYCGMKTALSFLRSV